MSKLRVLNTCQNPNPGDVQQGINLLLPNIPIQSQPAGKYWPPGRPEDASFQRPQDVP